MSHLNATNFSRYLRAKKTVDDRSLNLRVYQGLAAALTVGARSGPRKIVEMGCGVGTMVERLWDWELAPQADYTAIDREPVLIAEARVRLAAFARQRRLTFTEEGESLRLAGDGQDWRVTFQAGDFLEFCQGQAGKPAWDLVVAHAFLDLVDLEKGLPALLGLLAPGGIYYFTLNFDGATIFQPPVDRQLEDQIIGLYHGSMDERQGGAGGHSQTGRRLLRALCEGPGEILGAGSSDWLVWPTPARSYPADEAYFLDYVLATIHRALAFHPDLDQKKFEDWLARRRAQLAAGELILAAHQLDVCGRVKKSG